MQTQRYVRVYNLAEQKLLKTLLAGIRWISSMDIHPMGDHLIVGGYDRKLCWFDLELSDKPYKVLRYVELMQYEQPRLTCIFLIVDTTPELFDPFNSTRRIHCLPRHRMTALFKYSMPGYITT